MVSRKRDAAKTAASAIAESGDVHMIVVRVGEEKLALELKDVSEIVRIPRLAHMPLAPPSLLGLANLRGTVLPVVSLRRLLGFPDVHADDATRVVVIERRAPFGFVVDRVETLRAVAAAQISVDRAGSGRLDPELLNGVIKGDEGAGAIKIVNPDRMLRGKFDRIGIAAAPVRAQGATAATPQTQVAEPLQRTALVSFDLGTQEYALPLARVNEIISVPAHVSEIAGAESAVVGVMTLRDRLLPLVSLRALLGLPQRDESGERGRIIVVSMGNANIGVVADRTREILRIDPAWSDPAPALLTRGAGEAEIESICRLNGGERLVAVLSPDRLFRSELVRRVVSQASNDGAQTDRTRSDMTEEQIIVFRLGPQEYGIPVAAVAEVVRASDRITPMPKAPAFIDGVINLRGTVIPIVDLRRRFEIVSDEPAAGRRVLVLAVAGTLTGFLVDAVSQLLRIPSDAIRPAPELSDEQMRLIGRVVNLEDRMILLVDPRQLLDDGEVSRIAILAQAATPSQPLPHS